MNAAQAIGVSCLFKVLFKENRIIISQVDTTSAVDGSTVGIRTTSGNNAVVTEGDLCVVGNQYVRACTGGINCAANCFARGVRGDIACEVDFAVVGEEIACSVNAMYGTAACSRVVV